LHGVTAEDYGFFVSLVDELDLGLQFGHVIRREEELPLSLLCSRGTVSVWVIRDDWPLARAVLGAMFPWCDGLSSEPRWTFDCGVAEPDVAPDTWRYLGLGGE
jgi:hypothetical protein